MKTQSSMLASIVAMLLVGVAIAIKEPRTGISFPDKMKGSSLSKLGVRTKGPIKVYAVGQYDDSFLLKMSYSVGAEKMSSALADALKPRCSDSGAVANFKEMMLKGLPDGAKKGTTLLFGTNKGKLTFAVNDKEVGSIASKPLASGFSGIYTDKKAVCKLNPIEEE
mmetsp:Transcript_47041/g.142447  ORF Transcript_47041/g.142447 Transcript_47041/m.142447 type:complete len:166 (-) Transcript_47041:462-959(-)